MRKLKLLMMACALMGAGQAWAQTDVTSTYLQNPSFELSASGTNLSADVKASNDGALSIYGWTETLGNTNYNNREIIASTTKGSNSNHSSAIAAAEGAYHLFMRRSWNNNSALDFTYKSNTGTYAPGYYTVTYSYILEEGTSQGNTTTGSYMTLKALNGSDVVASEKVNAKNWGTTTPYTNSWTTSTMSFTIEEEKELALAVVITPRGGNKTEVHIDNFTITYTDFKAELRTVIAQAQAINARISTLSDEIATAQSVLNTASSSKTAIDGAVTTLRSAISTKLAAYTGLNAAGDDITSFIVNNGFETSPTFDGTSLGSGSDPKSNASPTDGSTLLFNAKNVYQVNGWELLTTETSDFARTFTMPYDNTLYVVSSNAVAGQAVTSPTNGSSVTTSNDNILFVEANWCNNAVLGVKQTIPLPAGSYRLTFDSYVTTNLGNNSSLCGISYDETTDYKWPTALNTWTANEIDFTLDDQTDVTISMGYKKTANVSGGDSPFLFVDNVKLTYFDPVKLAQIQWKEVWDVLDDLDETALPDAAEEAITTELAKEMPTTVEDCETAKAALQTLIDSYNGIKASYDKVLALIDLATYEMDNSTGTKTTIAAAISTATTNIETCTTASALDSDYSTLETARQTYVTSGAQPSADHVFDYTFKIADAAITDANDWSSKRLNYNQQYTGAPDNTYFDNNNENRNIQKNIGALRLGHYELKCATRAHADVTVGNIYVSQDGANLNQTNINHVGASGGDLGNGWSWTTVSFDNYDSSKDITLGFYSECGSSKWAGADDFHLYYKGNAIDDETAEALIETVVSGKMNATVESTQSSALSDFESEQTFENYNALKDAITAASASKTAYAKLKTELDKMPAAFGTTNVYTASAYTTNYSDVLDGYTDGSISTDDADAYSYGQRVTGAMPAIMLSSWKVGETAALTDASLYMNTWSTEGNSDGSEITTPFYEYWVSSANALAEKTFTATVEGLTAGTNYLVTAKVRVRQQDDQTKADDDVTFQVNEGEVVNAADGTQSDVRSEMYYKTVRAFGEADEDGKLAIKVVVKDGNHVNWLAFKDVHYSEVTMPTDAHKTALASAISTAKSKTIGFAAGEYAPYTNIDARKALAAAQAIDVDVNTDDEVVVATTALTSATWTENTVEMNAVSDELFNGTEYGTAGWTRNVTWNNTGGDKSYSIPAGTMTYGELAYHEMPLEGNTVYKLTYGHRKWDSSNADNGGQVSVLNGSGEGLALTSYTGTSSQSLQNETYYFRTGAAGNYTFTVTAASGRLTFGNVIIKKAVAEDITIAEDASAVPAYQYANVTIARAFNKGWNAVCLPFETDAFDSAEIAEFTGESADGENVTLNFTKVSSFEANKPYLVYFPAAVAANKVFEGVIVNPAEVKTTGTAFDFMGTYIVKDIAVGDWVISGGALKKASSTISLKPTRTYFTPKEATARIAGFTIDGDETTGIVVIENKGQMEIATDAYNLSGQKMTGQLKKGIYIVNGKKTVVK